MADENKPGSEKETLTFYRNNHFSLSLEKEALDKLITLDIKNSREVFSSLIERVGSKKGNDFKQSLLVMYDLISKVNWQLLKITGNQKQYNMNRASIIQSLSHVEKKEELKDISLNLLAVIMRSLDPNCISSNPIVEKAKNYIEENYQKKLSLSKIAAIINVSKNYLSTLYKKECMQTITQYIHKIRMDRAEFLLRTTNNTISEIAFQVGYQTYRDFYRNFHKHKKVSPKSYRTSFLQKRS
ncbi:MAG: AraC family transcriptional regulator [Acidobacteriota bacterium]